MPKFYMKALHSIELGGVPFASKDEFLDAGTAERMRELERRGAATSENVDPNEAAEWLARKAGEWVEPATMKSNPAVPSEVIEAPNFGKPSGNSKSPTQAEGGPGTPAV